MGGNIPWNGTGRPQTETLNEQTADTAAGWRRIHVEQYSTGVIRYWQNGLPASHPLYYSPWQPRDGDIALGIFLWAPDGVCNFFQTGDWWIYCPALDLENVQAGIPFIVGATSTGQGAPPAAANMAQEAANKQGNNAAPDGSMPAFRVENTTLLGTSNTGQAVQIGAFRPPIGFRTVILAPCSNSGHIYVSQTRLGTAGAAIELCPGTAIGLQIQNWNVIWVAGLAGDKVTVFVEAYNCYAQSSSGVSSSSSSSSSST